MIEVGLELCMQFIQLIVRAVAWGCTSYKGRLVNCSYLHGCATADTVTEGMHCLISDFDVVEKLS